MFEKEHTGPIDKSALETQMHQPGTASYSKILLTWHETQKPLTDAIKD